MEKLKSDKQAQEKQKAAEAEKRRQYQAAVYAAWQLAQAENTRKAWLYFAKTYPNHTLALEAKARAGQMFYAVPVFKSYYLLGLGGLITLSLLLFLWIFNFNEHKEKSDFDQSSKNSPFDIAMVFVKGGTFQMGSNKEAAEEKPIHTVTLRDFYLGQYEVTQKQWRNIMGSDPPELRFKGCDQCPVERVSWKDVQEFLLILNFKYPGHNYRLPSEAEWEYAARGGQQSKAYAYAGSSNIEEVSWSYKNSDGKTHPVGGKKANELGLYDLSGNVSEWCADVWHNDYKGAPSDGGVWLKGGDQAGRVLRGGSWYDYHDFCSPSFRNWNDTTNPYFSVGFRLARHP